MVAGCGSLNSFFLRRPRTAFGPSHREGLRCGYRLQGRDQESRKVGGDGIMGTLVGAGSGNSVAPGTEFLSAAARSRRRTRYQPACGFWHVPSEPQDGADALVFLLLLNSRDAEGLGIENQSVVLDGLAHDFNK